MPTRVVLLGASNLTRSLPLVVATAQAVAEQPVEIHAALGHGRSFGRRSRVFARALPGILECGLWAALDAAPPASRTLALVTDVGNDVVYGSSVGTIVGWVDECLARLARHEARVVLTQVPIESLTATGPLRLRIAKTVLFPRHAITPRQVMERVGGVARGLEQIAEQRSVPLCPLPGSWYGLDPIHIRRAEAPAAWARILAAWRPKLEKIEPPRPERKALRARWEHWWLFGRPRSNPQPTARLTDGTTLSLY